MNQPPISVSNPEFLRRAGGKPASPGQTWTFRASVVAPLGRTVICNRVEVSLGTTDKTEALARRDVLTSFLSKANLLSDAGCRKLEGESHAD